MKKFFLVLTQGPHSEQPNLIDVYELETEADGQPKLEELKNVPHARGVAGSKVFALPVTATATV